MTDDLKDKIFNIVIVITTALICFLVFVIKYR